MTDVEKLEQAIKLIVEVSESCKERHSRLLAKGIPLSTNEIGWASINLEFAHQNLKEMVKGYGRLTYCKDVIKGAGDHGKEEESKAGDPATPASTDPGGAAAAKTIG